MTTPGINLPNNTREVAELQTDSETVNITREHPPPYHEVNVTNTNSARTNEPIIHQTFIVQVPLQNHPMYYTCNICCEQVLTRVEYVNTRKTHMLAGFICGLTSWCMLCCLGALPYVIPTFQKAKHYCPICNNFLGDCRKYD